MREELALPCSLAADFIATFEGTLMKIRAIISALALVFGSSSLVHAECPKVTSTTSNGASPYNVSGEVFIGNDPTPVTKFGVVISENQGAPFQMETEVTYLKGAEQQQNQDGSPRVLVLDPGTFTVGFNAVFGIARTANEPTLSFCARQANLDRMDDVKSMSGYAVQVPQITRRELSQTGVPLAVGQEQVFEGDGWRVKLRVDAYPGTSSS
jgi:hypothetical protein